MYLLNRWKHEKLPKKNNKKAYIYEACCIALFFLNLFTKIHFVFIKLIWEKRIKNRYTFTIFVNFFFRGTGLLEIVSVKLFSYLQGRFLTWKKIVFLFFVKKVFFLNFFSSARMIPLFFFCFFHFCNISSDIKILCPVFIFFSIFLYFVNVDISPSDSKID